MTTAIIVPARYGSTRFPGKPLAQLGGKTMIVRTAQNAELAAEKLGDAVAIVATDDPRIMEHCIEHNLLCIMTNPDLPSGSDRALAAVQSYEAESQTSVDIIVNLQGDAPFTPASHVEAVVESLRKNMHFDVATPYLQLDWLALDQLRKDKLTTPFSGTTLVADENGKALWFSKAIIPALRKEALLRESALLSPICRHIGLYAYRKAALERFVSLPVGHWESLEGLEQLRCLENGLVVGCVSVEAPEVAISGIDTPEDLLRAEAILRQNEA